MVVPAQHVWFGTNGFWSFWQIENAGNTRRTAGIGVGLTNVDLSGISGLLVTEVNTRECPSSFSAEVDVSAHLGAVNSPLFEESS
jgi:hypothetical protein